MKIKNTEKEKKKLSYKIGKTVGNGIDRFIANKKFKIAFVTILFVLLFIFVIPIKNNIVTISALIVLLIISLIIKKRGGNDDK